MTGMGTKWKESILLSQAYDQKKLRCGEMNGTDSFYPDYYPEELPVIKNKLNSAQASCGQHDGMI